MNYRGMNHRRSTRTDEPRQMSNIPRQMDAVWVTEPGGADKLTIKTLATPRPAPGEVLIKVAAAGLNRGDIVQRMGFYPPPPGTSEVMGLEVSGTIVALGDDVETWQLGDQVCALVPGGGYAQYCVASALTCLPVPAGVSLIEAASLPETYATVWSNVFDRAGLQKGESFLVHGGTSGIGTTAIMLAKAFGATVFATAGSQEKCQVCTDLGADAAINDRTGDFVDMIKSQTARGVDVILDMVGGEYIARNIRCLAPDGRLVNIGFQAGSKAEIDFMPVMLKRLTLTGSTLRIRDNEFKHAIMRNLTEKVWPLIENGTLRTMVDSLFPLDRVADAHQRMESSRHIGKILLTLP